MHAQHAPAAFRHDHEVTLRLCLFQDAEVQFLARDRSWRNFKKRKRGKCYGISRTALACAL